MINIQRNFYVESILQEAKINRGLDISQIPYTDNLRILDNKNLSLVLIDVDRLKSSELFKNDIKSLKKKQNCVILVPISKNKKKIEKLINYVEKLNCNKLIVINIYKLGVNKIVDVKRDKIFKSYLTVNIQIALAKVIENILSLLLNNDIRLASIDLDNTCWTGVVGEDGPKKIFLDTYQKKSLTFINKLIHKTGLIVSIHSKNNEKIANKGITNKLSKYTNIIKKSFKYINWESKIKSIKKITKIVNFSKKNIIYLDDNISEIKQINKFLLKKHCFWIKNSYLLYLYSKSFYISNINKEKNNKRFKDIKSNIIRSEIAESKGILNYIKSSDIKVQFKTKNLDLKRCEEMSNKTNQFNSNYQRLKLNKIKILTRKKNIQIATFSASDKYSDSGIIANIILQKNKLYDQIIEFTMSCRALGRGLEYFFLYELIKKFKIQELRINYIKTDRNEPFIKFAETIYYKKDKYSYWINIKKIKNVTKNYENFIKTKIN